MAGALICSIEAIGYYLILAVFTVQLPPVSEIFLVVTTLGVSVLFTASTGRGREMKERERLDLALPLEKLALIDMLTDCLNQQTFIEKLKQEVEHSWRYGQCLSLLGYGDSAPGQAWKRGKLMK